MFGAVLTAFVLALAFYLSFSFLLRRSPSRWSVGPALAAAALALGIVLLTPPGFLQPLRNLALGVVVSWIGWDMLAHSQEKSPYSQGNRALGWLLVGMGALEVVLGILGAFS